MAKNKATERSIQWAKDNPARYRLNQKRYRDNHKQNMTEEEIIKRKKQNKEWRINNKDKINECKKRYVKKRRLVDEVYRRKLNQRKRDWADKNKEYVREYSKKRYSVYYLANRELYALRSKEKRVNDRLEVLYYYSDGDIKCNICGEKYYEFLAVDHLDNNGRIHRTSGELRRYSNDIVKYLIAMGFPEGYQILCHNCNTKKYRNGIILKNPGAAYIICRKKRKREILNKYSNNDIKCACCDERDMVCLTIHHINGGGTQHRKDVNNDVYQWLKNNNYPEGYRVLCQNCNKSLGHYGYCPHNKD
jgi:hypothetical protein